MLMVYFVMMLIAFVGLAAVSVYASDALSTRSKIKNAEAKSPAAFAALDRLSHCDHCGGKLHLKDETCPRCGAPTKLDAAK